MNLYGIRKEKFIENGIIKNNVVFLLISRVNGVNKKYEFFLNNLKLREVDAFISPNFLIVGTKYSFDIKKFADNIKRKNPFEDNLLLYNCKHKGNLYNIILTNDLFLNGMFVDECKSIRIKEKRPVWIFKGGSGLGKSYISSFCRDFKNIYETDCSESLPDVIYSDIIVLGNKYKFSEDEIKLRLFGECEVIIVDFNKG